VTTPPGADLESLLQQRRTAANAQQQQLINAAAPISVTACPGAGKTRTIVERHCATPPGQPNGRAIASFTKVAAAQIRRRATALGRPDLLLHPHAITTLDGFFWRFLVRPFLPRKPDEPVFRHLESWQDAPHQLRRIEYQRPGTPGRMTFDLAEFQFQYAGGETAPAPSLTGYRRTAGGRRRLSDAEIADVCALAADRRKELANTHHLFTGEEVRLAATRYIHKYRDRLSRTLPARFSELIVDEAQDCSAVDVNLIEQLRDLGLPTLTIGDPDQAIYGFRTATVPAATRLFHTEPTLRLTGNWRSSATICRLAATLRAGTERRVDAALADHHDTTLPVWLLPRDECIELTTFAALTADAGIAPHDRLILAHASQTLPGTGANARRPPMNSTEALLWAVAVLRHRVPDRRARDTADKTLRAAILRFWFADADTTTAADVQDCFGINPHHLTRLTAQALADLPDLDTPTSEWCAQARTLLTAMRPATGRPSPSGRSLTAPASKGHRKAAALARIGAATGDPLPDTRIGTVHSVKGDEAAAVLVLVPDEERTDRLITLWTSGRHDAAATDAGDLHDAEEALRVLYVAVTRARRLVTLALPPQHIPTVQRMLEDNVIRVKATT
jgi:DNA helicase II / ATP-dependent DNA helicase PcrA